MRVSGTKNRQTELHSTIDIGDTVGFVQRKSVERNMQLNSLAGRVTNPALTEQDVLGSVMLSSM